MRVTDVVTFIDNNSLFSLEILMFLIGGALIYGVGPPIGYYYDEIYNKCVRNYLVGRNLVW